MKLTIKFSGMEQVKQFVDITSKYSAKLSLVHGHYTVDAKSLLGIFSMDLTKPLELVADRAVDGLKDELEGFLVA